MKAHTGSTSTAARGHAGTRRSILSDALAVLTAGAAIFGSGGALAPTSAPAHEKSAA